MSESLIRIRKSLKEIDGFITMMVIAKAPLEAIGVLNTWKEFFTLLEKHEGLGELNSDDLIKLRSLSGEISEISSEVISKKDGEDFIKVANDLIDLYENKPCESTIGVGFRPRS